MQKAFFTILLSYAFYSFVVMLITTTDYYESGLDRTPDNPLSSYSGPECWFCDAWTGFISTLLMNITLLVYTFLYYTPLISRSLLITVTSILIIILSYYLGKIDDIANISVFIQGIAALLVTLISVPTIIFATKTRSPSWSILSLLVSLITTGWMLAA